MSYLSLLPTCVTISGSVNLCRECLNVVGFPHANYIHKEGQEELTRVTCHSLNVAIHNYIVCVCVRKGKHDGISSPLLL